MRLGLIVAEASGDKLAAHLLQALQEQFPDLTVEGVLGPACEALGYKTWFPMHQLSVMGLLEPLKRLPTLLRIRRACLNQFLNNPPDCFIGVDSPDFNLSIEKPLYQRGIPTVHVVSPSVWAWRQGRIKTIQQAVSLMLPLFPFEARFYENKDVPVQCIGHPLADSIPLDVDSAAAKRALGLENKTVVALLPGSRDAELRFMLPIYLKTAAILRQENPTLCFVVPVVSEAHRQIVQTLLKTLALSHLPVFIEVQAMSRLLPAADAVLVTSGTATLEVLLYQKPMVIAYKTDWLTYEIVKRLIKVPYVGLPNLLMDKKVVPELIQSQATPENCAAALKQCLDATGERHELIRQFRQLHQQLKKNAGKEAAIAIQSLLEGWQKNK